MSGQDATVGRDRPASTSPPAALPAALETADMGIFVLDSEFTVRWINETAATYFGLSQEAVIGRDKAALIESTIQSIFERPERFAETVLDTYADNTYVEEFECHVLADEKRAERWLLHRSKPIRSGALSGGRIEHYTDITELKTSQRRLEAQRDDLEVLNQVVRHDIRNDLQLVSAYADMLEPHVDAAGEAHRERIADSAANAIELTESARDLAEIMLSRQAETTPIAIGEVLDTQIAEVSELNPAATVRTEGSVPEVEVLANALLGSVIRNLLTNAIQHNRREEPTVTVSVTDDDQTVTIRVADDGPGIPDRQKQQLFGKGQKGLDSGGTGIGLYLVETLVDSYDGAVWIEDRDDQAGSGGAVDGAVFVVELPVAG
ncbi:MAG: ATP-binding protein [Halohasta sp.]